MTGPDYDVVVVGARVAGAPAAMLFARRGHRVLLLDRAVFPADTLSTLYIQQPGVARLARWGLLEEVRATGCPPLDHVVYELEGIRVEGCSSGVDGIRAAYAPRRHLLDGILADAAAAAGAEVLAGHEVVDLVREGERVTGVRHRSPDGGVATATARLVVGADGMRSAVARLAGAATAVERPRLTCAYYSFWQGLDAVFEMYEGPTGWVATVPTNDAVLVSAYFPQGRFERVRKDALDSYTRCIEDNAPALFERLLGKQRLERLYGTGDQRNFFRQARGPGWALIGDAGHHKDSLTAQGIGDAFMQAELLVDSVADGLADEAALTAGLAAFAEERDRRLTPYFNATLLVAQAEGREQRRALLAALAEHPDHTQRYFDAVAGILPLEQLYTPELMALVAQQAKARSAVS
ncbi:FAD-dependent oxidoreductase [Saccharothrix coeruleofusca]|uniref:FAD-dependent oxidoreductase n=1 Tax=Saccharothrix coeruleofusca TaxID=33919 RepID=A0A918EG46_9PSEU|nr:FAD-dependent monooxygenase [Saccharothrix coeruleofusca]MBP2336646.1 flavin-dependent dehydrogenase [Saccharothrix coeruleofusca]GGP78990.1 FAD-dependent oxidoreductase [Saccharothrix coeruleofusca]